MGLLEHVQALHLEVFPAYEPVQHFQVDDWSLTSTFLGTRKSWEVKPAEFLGAKVMAPLSNNFDTSTVIHDLWSWVSEGTWIGLGSL